MMKMYFVFLILLFNAAILFSQELSWFDSIKIDLPQTIHMDTGYANRLYFQSEELRLKNNYISTYQKADTARQVYINYFGIYNKQVALCISQMGMALYFEDKYEDSNFLLFKALHIFKNIGQEQTRICSVLYSYLGLNYMKLSKFDLAIACQKKNLEIRLNIYGDGDFNLANTYHQIGNTYMRKGDYNQALTYHHLALSIRERYKKGKAASYESLGTIHRLMGDYKSAIDYNKKALNIALKLVKEDDPAIAMIYNNLANCFRATGELDKAIEYHLKCIKIRKLILPDDHPDLALSYSNLGNCYREKGAYNKAIGFHNLGLLTYLKRFDHNSLNVADAYLNLSAVYGDISDLDRAFEFMKRSNEIKINILGENNIKLAPNYNNLGLHYAKQNNFEKSLEYYLKSDNLYKNEKVYKDLAQVYYDIGILYFKNKNINEALSYFHKSLYFDQKYSRATHPSIIKTLDKLISAYIITQEIDSAQFYVDIAIDAIRQQIIADVDFEAKFIYQARNRSIFEKAIVLSLIQSEERKDKRLLRNIFKYSGMSRSTLLQLQIKQNDALGFSGIPDSLLEKEQNIRIGINYREKQRLDLIESGKMETDSSVLSKSAEIFDLKREQEDLLSNFEKNYPDYYRLKYDLTTVSLEETQQKLLLPGQCLLQYFVGDSSIFPMVITKDTFAVLKIKKDFALDSLVSALQGGLYGYYSVSKDMQTDDLYKSSIKSYISSSTELYRRLVQPVGHLLTRDVIIAPDGVLGYIPFEALLDKQPEDPGRFEAYPYFIRDHKVSYTYSATLLKEMKDRKHKKQPQKKLAGFAPFYTGSYAWLDSTINIVFDTLDDGRDTTLFRSVVTRKDFMPLPYSGEEVFSAAKLLKGDYFINRDATEQKFYEVAGDYRIVHLATHGVADSRQGDYSYLAFAEQKDSIENEFLYVRDIYNTSLNADLVVLSACETARGELQRGEGIISLARAFAYAGAKSMLTTLWVVDDVATKDIMKDFYYNLHRGQEKDTALRNAKLNHLTRSKIRYRHPFFWAGFIAIGDMAKL